MTREEAITAIKTWIGFMRKAYKNNECTMEFVDAAETLMRDALKQSERAHGHWTRERTYAHDGELYCSHCDCDAPAEYGRYTYMETDFCPNCGAIMDEEEE